MKIYIWNLIHVFHFFLGLVNSALPTSTSFLPTSTASPLRVTRFRSNI
jgi:hypothetical protein